jgi:DNA repair photolyase
MKILSKPKGNAEEYGRWSVNPYVGCPHGCEYCYLKKGVWKNALGGSEPTLKNGIVNETHAFHLAWCEILDNREQILKDGGLFMSFVTDPLCEGKPIDNRFHHEGSVRTMFLALAKGAVELGVPVTILTKSAGFTSHFHYKDIAGKTAMYDIEPSLKKAKDMIAFGWTLTGHDEMEPNAPSNARRLEEMKAVHDDGLKVWSSIEPVIDFKSSLEMIAKALDAGCQHFKIGLLTENTRVCRKKYDVIECMGFITDVLTLTNGKATVYWKQSVRDLLGTVYSIAAVDEILDQPNAVGKDWNMFDL